MSSSKPTHDVFQDGTILPRIPYGEERFLAGIILPEQCHDCDTPLGDVHEIGCDIERCSFCGGQLISCSCR